MWEGGRAENMMAQQCIGLVPHTLERKGDRRSIMDPEGQNHGEW